MIKYKVWSASPRYFTDFSEARKYANHVFKTTGDIVAITSYKARK